MATLFDLINQQSGNNPAAWANWNNNQSAWQGSLPPELLNGVLNNGWRYAPGTDVSGSNSPSEFIVRHGAGAGGEGEWGTGSQGPAQAIEWHPRGQGAGESYDLYDTSGKFLRTETGAKNMSYAQGILAVAGAGAGFGALGAAAGGAGAAGAGGAEAAGGAGVTGLGDAGTMYAGGTAGDAATLGGGGSFTGAGMGATYGAGAGAGVTGFGDSGTMYAGSNANAASTLGGGASVNGGAALPASGGPSLSDALRVASKVYGQMGQQQTQQAQMPIMGMQDNRPSSFVGQAPGYAPIASPPKRSPMLGGLNNPWSPYMVGLMGGTNG